MDIIYLTGRAPAVRKRVFAFIGEALSHPEAGEAILLVPDQHTLQAEMDALEELNLPGSFRLQVLSPQRLYQRIFQQAGGPRETLVDEQGRVMLMHAAARRMAKELTWYKGAAARPGFAEKCVSQVTAFKQAGLCPQDLLAMAQERQDALSAKLRDLACLYQAYEDSLAGRFMDGEDQARRACLKMENAPFLRGAQVCVYGFDLITPTLRTVILSLLPLCSSLAVAMVLAEDEQARDGALFTPVDRSLKQLSFHARQAGARIRQERLSHSPRPGALGHLEKELFCIPQSPYDHKAADVQIALSANPQEEAEFAAALVRRLCRTKGWRYRDFALACPTGSEEAFHALNRAFQLYKVPLFLTQGRSADKHPLSQCLLSALRAVSRGFALTDMTSYIRSGFSPLADSQADILVNYAQAHGLRRKAWRQSLVYGQEEELLQAEPLRQAAMEPLEALLKRIEEAKDLEGVLGAVFALLEDLKAYDRLEEQRQTLEKEGLGLWAAEGIQVWNRIVEALDQMAELLGDQNMKLKEVYELLRRALSASVIKSLPQSADAVEGGSLEHLRSKPVKALLVVGVTDASSLGQDSLLADEEVRLLRDGGIDLGMNLEEKQRMKRLSLKSLLSMTKEYLLISRPQSDGTGRAVQNGALLNEAIRLLPQVRVRGGVTGDEAMLEVRLGQADGALCRLPSLLKGKDPLPRAALEALESMEDMQPALKRMKASFRHKVSSEALDPSLARQLMHTVPSVSATRLERFAACPFMHFAHYALRPQEFRPFSLSPRDAGNFYHQALETFVDRHAQALGDLSPQEGQALMDDIASQLLSQSLGDHMAQGALAQAEGERLRRVARRAADVIVRQFDGSHFRPAQVEVGIGRDEVKLDGHTAVGGRIDRVDLWQGPEGQNYFRIIDYKTGGRTLSLQSIYYGLQLQLVLYLAAAQAQLGGIPAGAFYFTVDDPLIQTDSLDPREVEEQREKALRLEGLALNDSQVIRAMASQPQQAINVAFKADGGLRSSEKLLEAGDFRRLIDHALDTARQMTRKIRQGCTEISPALLSGQSPCTYCDYKTVCGFDPRLEGARPRRLKKMNGRDVIQALNQDLPEA